MRRSIVLAALTGAAMVGLAGCSGSTDVSVATTFTASLTGAAERPDPVTTSATGTATITIDETAQTINAVVTITNLTTITMAHIHVGATDVAGAIALSLLPVPPAVGSFTGTLVSATFNGSAVVGGETFATLVAKLRAGTAYVNVHTVAHASGEIRGQLAAQN